MKTYYLAHPFDSRRDVRAWEIQVESLGLIKLYNPFYDAAHRTDVEAVDAGRAPKYTGNPARIVSDDLAALRSCNGLVGIIDGSLSYGTIMEIVYGKRIHDILHPYPTYLIVTNGHENHPWLRYHATRIFTSREAFVAWLQEHASHETAAR